MWARGFYRDHVLANAKYRAYSHFCWPCLESRTHTRMTQSVISDRLVRIQARDGQVIRKHIWPGSGNVGREHLLREWQMHNLVYQNFNLSSRRLVTTPLSKAADSSWFEQEDFSQSRSLWAVAQTDFDELAEVLPSVLRVVGLIHTKKQDNSEAPAAMPEMPYPVRLDFAAHCSLPVWGRSFIGKYSALLDRLGSELEGLEPDSAQTHRLIHGDLTADNVLVSRTDEEPIRIVDWERGGYGVREHDLAALYGSILASSYYALAGEDGTQRVSETSLSRWIDKWQNLIVDIPVEYKHPINPHDFRVLLAAKLIARGYSRSIFDGPNNPLSALLGKIAGTLLAAPRKFATIWDAGMIV